MILRKTRFDSLRRVLNVLRENVDRDGVACLNSAVIAIHAGVPLNDVADLLRRLENEKAIVKLTQKAGPYAAGYKITA